MRFYWPFRNKKIDNSKIRVCLVLLEEGTPTIRSTEAEIIGDGLYKLLPTPDYDYVRDIWEYFPWSFVNAHHENGPDGKIIIEAMDQISWGRGD